MLERYSCRGFGSTPTSAVLLERKRRQGPRPWVQLQEYCSSRGEGCIGVEVGRNANSRQSVWGEGGICSQC
jgi:hypothetical protein